MAFGPGKNTAVLVGDYDLTSYFQTASVAKRNTAIETTPFGVNDETYIAGLGGGSFNLAGGWDVTADVGTEDALKAILEGAVNVPVSVYQQGHALGNRVALGRAIQTELGIDSTPEDMVRVAAAMQVSSPLLGGWSLHALGSETITGSGSSVDGTALTTFGGIAHLHVTAVSGGTPQLTVNIQDSATGAGGWATVGTFTVATGITSEQITIAGSVDRYLRADWTISGTSPDFTFAVSFARKKR